MKIVQFGLPRSGTTLIYRLLLRVMHSGDILIKTHEYHPEVMKDALTIVTVRDIRDIMVSQYRCDAELNGGRAQFPMGKRGVDGVTRFNQEKLAKHFWPTVNTKSSILILKYEEFYNDIEFTLGTLCSTLQRPYPENAPKIIEQCSIDSAKKLIGDLDSFKQIGPEFLHGNHIFSPDPGIWKTAILPEYHTPITYLFKEYLDRYGYDTLPNHPTFIKIATS
jgi:hypothetical protein